MFFLPLNLIQIQGYSEVNAGLAMLPIIICIASISPLMGKFVDRRGVRLPLIVGPIITSVGFFIFSVFDITEGPEVYWNTFFICFLLIGIGMGITVAPLTTAVMGSVSEDNIGIGSGVNNTIARAAGVIAVALMGALVLFSFNDSIEQKIKHMNVSDTMKDEIMFESLKLAAAEAPSGLSVENKTFVEQLIKDSFISAFNKVVYVASILTLLGGIVAFIFIRPQKEKKATY